MSVTTAEKNEMTSLHDTELIIKDIMDKKFQSFHSSLFDATTGDILPKMAALQLENQRLKDEVANFKNEMHTKMDEKWKQIEVNLTKQKDIDREVYYRYTDTVISKEKETNQHLVDNKMNTVKHELHKKYNDHTTETDLKLDTLREELQMEKKRITNQKKECESLQSEINKLQTLFDRVELAYSRNTTVLQNVNAEIARLTSQLNFTDEAQNTKYLSLKESNDLSIKKQENKIMNNVHLTIKEHLADYHKNNQNFKISFEAIYDDNQSIIETFLNKNSLYEKMKSNITTDIHTMNHQLFIEMKKVVQDKKLKKSIQDLNTQTNNSIDNLVKLDKMKKLFDSLHTTLNSV